MNHWSLLLDALTHHAAATPGNSRIVNIASRHGNAGLHSKFLPAHDLVPNGNHHEIYLDDPKRVAPGKLRTVLRQPVRSSG